MLFICSVANVSGQEQVELTLEAAYPEGLGHVERIRELSNGRILVADPIGQVLLSIDVDMATSDTIGGIGSGPNEYRQPDAVFPLVADTSLLVDLGNGRLIVVAPDGTFGETIRMAQGSPGTNRIYIIMPRFTDSFGRIYFQDVGVMIRANRTSRDSVAVARFDRQHGTVDIVGSLKRIEERNDRVIPLSSQDDWAVGLDGSVAVIRSRGYYIDWLLPNGDAIRGPNTQYESIPISRREKERWKTEVTTNGLDMATFNRGGEVNVTVKRGAASGGAGTGIDSYEWPRNLPPFRFGRTIVSNRGELWVERFVSDGEPPVIDVFDRAGRKTGSTELPANRRVVGFGNGFVYLVYTDDVDLQWIERYRIVRR